ncbi:hypothetical protein G7046_g7415 [Stylonectria norvegica]|nr:hypothetical protein G7046_g7415 [Stylonectria norvegica]
MGQLEWQRQQQHHQHQQFQQWGILAFPYTIGKKNGRRRCSSSHSWGISALSFSLTSSGSDGIAGSLDFGNSPRARHFFRQLETTLIFNLLVDGASAGPALPHKPCAMMLFPSAACVEDGCKGQAAAELAVSS